VEHLLVVVVARPQHHPVLAECDRLMIMIRRDVFDAENRHRRPILIDTPLPGIYRAKYCTLCPAIVSNNERDAEKAAGGRRTTSQNFCPDLSAPGFSRAARSWVRR
jgi:hypothetical protein